MKKILILALTITYTAFAYSQVNFCPKQDIEFDYQKALIATPDFELPILNIKKMFKSDNTYPGPFVKSIKLPEFIMGSLYPDRKTFLGYSDNYLYHINIETEEIRSFPFVTKGKLDSGEDFKWKMISSYYENTLFLYKYSRETELPLDLYKFNTEEMKVDLVWKTGMIMSSKVKFDNISGTDYWTYADKNGNALIIDLNSQKKIMEHKFSVPAEITSGEEPNIYIDFSASRDNAKNYQCNKVHFSITDLNANPRQNYFCKYDLSTQKELYSIFTDGTIFEQPNQGKTYWFVLKKQKESQSFKVYNDYKLSEIHFEFSDLTKSGLPWKSKYSKNSVLETITVEYRSGKKETYDFATKKLIKTEEAKVEITDF